MGDDECSVVRELNRDHDRDFDSAGASVSFVTLYTFSKSLLGRAQIIFGISVVGSCMAPHKVLKRMNEVNAALL